METILIQIQDQKAYRLLKNLEELQIIKVIKKSVLPKQKLSEKYAGKLSSDVVEELQNHTTESREEWGTRDI